MVMESDTSHRPSLDEKVHTHNANPEDIHSESDPETGLKNGEPTTDSSTWNWDTDAHNPYNWPTWKKTLQIIAISGVAFVAYVSLTPEYS